METDQVVFAIPVAAADLERAGRTFAAWKKEGYGTAALIDLSVEERLRQIPNCDRCFLKKDSRGWADGVNELCRRIHLPNWIVTGSIDTLPHAGRKPKAIAAECERHFGGTLGIMQPTGDLRGATQTRVACVLPWIGREWINRAYQGRGPVCGEYIHSHAEVELLQVAEKLGCLWRREDLTQNRDLLTRLGGQPDARLGTPVLQNGADGSLYHSRRGSGFPGHELKAGAWEEDDPHLLERLEAELLAKAFSRDPILEESVRKIIQGMGIMTVVETGTWRGSTSRRFSQMLPEGGLVHTIEIDPGNFAVAAGTLLNQFNVIRHLGDSGKLLARLVPDLQGPTLFYLDAHWYDRWPLFDELDVIAAYGQPCAIVIHDMKVPGRDFGFDTYDGKDLSFELVKPHLDKLRFPWRHYFNDQVAPGSYRRGVLFVVPETGKEMQF